MECLVRLDLIKTRPIHLLGLFFLSFLWRVNFDRWPHVSIIFFFFPFYFFLIFNIYSFIFRQMECVFSLVCLPPVFFFFVCDWQISTVSCGLSTAAFRSRRLRRWKKTNLSKVCAILKKFMNHSMLMTIITCWKILSCPIWNLCFDNVNNKIANDCYSDRQNALEDVKNGAQGMYVPECTPDNKYQRVQCHKTAGKSWNSRYI